MKAVLTRVTEAEVLVEGKRTAKIGLGYVIFLGVQRGDTIGDADFIADKILKLRLIENADKKFDKSIEDVNGDILLIPQFTLFADIAKGKRPFFGEAEESSKAEKFFAEFVDKLRSIYKNGKIDVGVFGEKMQINATNNGPVTLILDSRNR